jgi:GxxExxY protein
MGSNVRENEVAAPIVDTAFRIHQRLGPGLLESVYQSIMVHELRKRGLRVDSEVLLPIVWDDLVINDGLRIDMIVENVVIVELKSLLQVAPVHKKQLLTYLRLANCRLGLLINFGEELIKDGISRVVNGLCDEPDPSS